MKKTLSRADKIIYGSGDLGFSLTATIIGAYFLFFLTDVVQIKPAVAGIAILIGKTWDYINDPLIGHLSDRTRSRWGRRRPYLLFGAIPFALAFIMMWYTLPFTSTTALTVYYAAAYVVFDAAATFVYMPYFALTPELILFAELDGKPIGFFPALPNFNEALIHASGLRYPWDYPIALWHTHKHPKSAAIKSVLVPLKYWGSGVAILMFSEMAKALLAKGYEWADLSLTPTDNHRTPALAERIGAKIYKRYRVYRLTF